MYFKKSELKLLKKKKKLKLRCHDQKKNIHVCKAGLHLYDSDIVRTVWGKQTLVSIWPAFDTGHTVSSQTGPSAMRLGGELRELCDRGPLLFQNIHRSRTTLLIQNVTQSARNAASLILLIVAEEILHYW